MEKHHNIVHQEEWKKVEEKDQKNADLTTSIKFLKFEISTYSGLGSNYQQKINSNVRDNGWGISS